MSPSSAGKRNREQAKRDKAEAKRQKRQATQSAAADQDPSAMARRPAAPTPTEELLRRIEEVHRLHDGGGMSDDDFQTAKADLLSRLQID